MVVLAERQPDSDSPVPRRRSGGSGGVLAFEYFFHRLTEPFQHTGNYAFYWDRGSIFPYRRAFFSKPLIVSSGPDQQLGIFLLYPSLRVPELHPR